MGRGSSEIQAWLRASPAAPTIRAGGCLTSYARSKLSARIFWFLLIHSFLGTWGLFVGRTRPLPHSRCRHKPWEAATSLRRRKKGKKSWARAHTHARTSVCACTHACLSEVRTVWQTEVLGVTRPPGHAYTHTHVHTSAREVRTLGQVEVPGRRAAEASPLQQVSSAPSHPLPTRGWVPYKGTYLLH